MLRLVTLLMVIGCSCGAPPAIQAKGRMIDGPEVTIEERPFQLSVMYLETYKCNAAIIGNNWALTTATCATPPKGEEVNPEYFHLRAGSAKVQTGGNLHTVERVIIHEDFESDNLVTPNFDVAVMRVASPFIFDATTQPCKMWVFDFPPPDSEFLVSGYDSQLLLSRVQVIDQKYCLKDYEGVPNTNITIHMFCSEQVNDDTGPCDHTDIGSPLTADGKLIGVVAHPTCNEQGLPNTYTNVMQFRVWIFTHTGIVF